jgi:membrane protein
MRTMIGTVAVEKPLSHVYDQWTRMEDFPSFMPGVASVRQLDERTTSWVLVIAKERREFAAVVTEQRPDNRIAWKGLGVPAHTGVVIFHRLTATRTRVTVQVEWEPVGTFDEVGDKLGLVTRHLDKALHAFAAHVEAQDVAPEGWRGTIEPSDDDLPDELVAAAREGSGRKARGGGGKAKGGRSSSDGRGRTAESPTEMPPKGWLDVMKRSAKQVKADDLQTMAAAVAFYLFLSIIPALTASISLYGLVSDPDEVQQQLEDVTSGLPESAANLITEEAEGIAAAGSSALSFGLAVSVILALYSASKGTQALIKALNVAYDEEEDRGFVKMKLLSFGLTVLIILVVVGGVAALVLVGSVAEDLGAGRLVTAARWPVLGAILVLVLAVLYRFSPNRDSAKWRWTTPGAILGAVLLVVASLAFSFYTSNFGEEAAGLLAAVGVLLLWLWLCALSILFGAEVDSELEAQTAKDTTKGDPQPMGQRDAIKADTVAR